MMNCVLVHFLLCYGEVIVPWVHNMCAATMCRQCSRSAGVQGCPPNMGSCPLRLHGALVKEDDVRPR